VLAGTNAHVPPPPRKVGAAPAPAPAPTPTPTPTPTPAPAPTRARARAVRALCRRTVRCWRTVRTFFGDAVRALCSCAVRALLRCALCSRGPRACVDDGAIRRAGGGLCGLRPRDKRRASALDLPFTADLSLTLNPAWVRVPPTVRP